MISNAYLRDFLAEAPLNPLGPAKPNRELVKRMRATKPQVIFGGPIRDESMASAVFAGLFLLADDLARSHELSQDIATPTGSYWHGIMHRREPDYGNAKYWFHRVGRHPVYQDVAAGARQLLTDHTVEMGSRLGSAEFLQNDEWAADDFVDLCSMAAKDDAAALAGLCRKVQRRECELLLEYCYRQALGL